MKRLNRKNAFYALLSGILIVLSLPHFNLWFLSWIALVPLLIAVHRANKTKSVFLLGLVTGIIYFLGMTYWIIPLYPFANIFLTVFATLLLAGYSAVYVAGFAVIVKKIRRWHSGLIYIIAASVFWTGLEWIRGWFLSGFPWGYFGYAQWKDLPFIQISSITGIYGVSFLLVLVNATIADFIIKLPKWRDGLKSAVIPVLVVIITFVYGFTVMSQEPKYQEKIEVVLVPGNIRQINKWKRQNIPWIFAKYVKTTIESVDESTDLVIWPETAIPINLIRRTSYFAQLQTMLDGLKVPLFLGIPYYNQGKYYNAAFLVSAEGEILDRYYKIHLVPFSESVPLKEYIPEVIREKVVGLADFDSGERKTIFQLPYSGIPFGNVICFESAFPELFRRFVNKGALFMGVITNDSWFEGTGCAEQHYAMAPFRAVENRRAIFHCANGGISCIIDMYGRETADKIVAFSENSDDIVKGEIAISDVDDKTIYTRYGDWFPIACSILLVGFAIKLGYDYFRQRKSSTE